MSKITIERSVVEQALLALNPTASGNWTPTIALNAESAIHALRAALEQPQVEQEPVAWIERWYGSGPERGWWIVCGRDHIAHLGPAEMSGEAASKIVSAHNTSPPAQREPLTDERINALIDEHTVAEGPSESLWHDCVILSRAVERTHGIK